jgi:hypothetical protein
MLIIFQIYSAWLVSRGKKRIFNENASASDAKIETIIVNMTTKER